MYFLLLYFKKKLILDILMTQFLIFRGDMHLVFFSVKVDKLTSHHF